MKKGIVILILVSTIFLQSCIDELLKGSSVVDIDDDYTATVSKIHLSVNGEGTEYYLYNGGIANGNDSYYKMKALIDSETTLVIAFNSSVATGTYGYDSSCDITYSDGTTSWSKDSSGDFSIDITRWDSAASFTFAAVLSDTTGVSETVSVSGYVEDASFYDLGDEYGDSDTPVVLPAATIIIDGSTGDWDGIDPLLTDSAGDISREYADWTACYMAQDTNYLYIRIDIVDTTGASSAAGSFFQPSFYLTESTGFKVDVHPGEWSGFFYPDVNGSYSENINLEQGNSTSCIEVSVPKSLIDVNEEYKVGLGSGYAVGGVFADEYDTQSGYVYIVFQ